MQAEVIHAKTVSERVRVIVGQEFKVIRPIGPFFITWRRAMRQPKTMASFMPEAHGARRIVATVSATTCHYASVLFSK
ncbi:hypothetical protein NZ708_05945 [Pseudomonas syringae pv. actinidiae ICMP 18708]|nr:hypothetical protein IYO_005950 [Pseudomonas syringae pv. actinidiae ICMP 18884]AOE55561.1 hypothetical protein NZ708_05945 [Pseudomonas syringae pv. actinidiae ICMP 18708]APP96421.1 hypothetical protein PsaNZ45_05945 [Pseudomonas syringae pv. actinidiae]AYL79556.1 hypothetical protein CN228_06090 [Pseudomonas syringae pv. actinidiae str. Shaanxi_M228]OKS49198.1 hypothetical protein PsaNZ63_25850 [Pseudomonas syringae pv. actinidiae]